MKNVKLKIATLEGNGFLNTGIFLKMVQLKDFQINFNLDCKIITTYASKLKFKITDIASVIQQGKENRIQFILDTEFSKKNLEGDEYLGMYINQKT